MSLFPQCHSNVNKHDFDETMQNYYFNIKFVCFLFEKVRYEL